MKFAIGQFVVILGLGAAVFAPDAEAKPTTCPDAGGNVQTYTTYVPCPRWDFLPDYGGGNHRYTDGTDE